MSDPELEAFKSGIDLRSFAAAHGYMLDARESWRGSAVMRHANGDKIVISRVPGGHFVYFSFRDERDKGTIIDFLRTRAGCSLGGARRVLRAWISAPARRFRGRFSELALAKPEAADIARRLLSMFDAARHSYLEHERKISASLLASPRMAGRIKSDARGNAIFPHFNEAGLCGYEIKNRGLTSFSKGGHKGLWLSNEEECDRRIIFAESAIDALSHAQLFFDPAARYASISGHMSPRQPFLVAAAIARMPSGSTVVAAMDADAQGDRLAMRIAETVERVGLGIAFRIDRPERVKDWNDLLQSS